MTSAGVQPAGVQSTGQRAAATHPRIPPRLLQLAIAAGSLLVVLAWWQNTLGLSGLGDWLTNAGRLTGLLAGYTIVTQLLLMARVPLIEHSVGADRLARWHAFGGRYTVSLAVAHALLITWGYAVTGHRTLVGQTSDLVLSYPDVLMATVALGLLLMVGWVSARGVRKKLSYETWYYLHFYTYLAVALAFSHQFATGAEFAGSLRNRVLWSLLYGGTAWLLFWYRFLVPVRTLVRHRMRIVDVQPEAPGVVSLILTGHHLEDLGAEPGQFFRWRFLARGHWWQSHPYSLSAPASPHRLRITIKDLGDHSAALQRIHRGTPVLAEGPYGSFTATSRLRRRVLLLAGGVGITPLRSLLETLPVGRGDLTLVYRVNHPDEFLFRAELDAIADRRGARVVYLAGPPASDSDPFIADRLGRLVPALSTHSVFVCGPPGFTEAAIAAARAAGVPRRHIHDEQFAF